MKRRAFMCIIGLHNWQFESIWEPSFDAPIVTKHTFIAKCMDCSKSKEYVFSFDGITGESE